MHFSWVSGGNEQWFSHWATPITDLASATFFISFFQGDILDTSPCDRSGIRRIEACEFCYSTTSRATWRGGSGYPHSSYKKALSFCIYCTATAFWNNTFFFFQEEKVHDFISNLTLPFPASNWKQSHQGAASGGFECWPGGTYRVYKRLLIIFSCFFSCMYSWDEHLTNSRGNHV